MNTETRVQPSLSVLTPSQIEQVHEYSLRILSSVGVRVDSERARQLFTSALGPKAVQGTTVRISADLIDWATQVAPSTVNV